MKKIVRKSVFETNSSSSHSLSVADPDQDFVLDTLYPDQHGVITVHDQEFGWAFEKYNDAMTKLAYLFQDQGDTHHDMIVDAVKEQTGAEDVVFVEDDGYIDHEGRGTTNEVCISKDEIINFVFNKNSWLFTGNDNSEPDPTFYDVPEYKDGKMILPEYTHELVIEGLKKTTKYQGYPDDEELDQGLRSLIEYDTLVDENGYFIDDHSIMWQISRPRDRFYKLGFTLEQDFNNFEILFEKENDDRWREIREELQKDPKTRDLPYYEKAELITKRALEMPGLVKKVKFEIKEIKK
jgi:hypothetical protein